MCYHGLLESLSVLIYRERSRETLFNITHYSTYKHLSVRGKRQLVFIDNLEFFHLNNKLKTMYIARWHACTAVYYKCIQFNY